MDAVSHGGVGGEADVVARALLLTHRNVLDWLRLPGGPVLRLGAKSVRKKGMGSRERYR